MILAIWIVFRTPSQSTAKDRLDVMVGDLSYLANNSTILSRHENAKLGAALVLYSVDASNFDKKEAEILKHTLKKMDGCLWARMIENTRCAKLE